jgi:hypothetical protein
MSYLNIFETRHVTCNLRSALRFSAMQQMQERHEQAATQKGGAVKGCESEGLMSCHWERVSDARRAAAAAIQMRVCPGPQHEQHARAQEGSLARYRAQTLKALAA